MTTDPRSAGRNLSLDALRGLAALAVVLHHYGFGYEVRVGPHNAAVPLFTAGHFGVELFFILSGFVITETLQRTPTLGDFIVNRVARLYPAFLVCCGLTLAVMALGGPNPLAVAPVSALAGLTMLSPIFQLPPIDPSHWTLCFEVSFYALAGLCFRRNMELACTIWLAAAVLSSSWLQTDMVNTAVLLYLPLVDLFIIGALLSRLVAGHLGILGLATFVAALGLTAHGPFADQGGLGRIGYVCLVLAFTGAVWAAATGRLRWLGRAPLVFLGTISYPLYLLHQILGFAIIRHLEAARWPAGAAIAAALAIVVLLSTLVRATVEVPAQRAIRRAWAARSPAAAEAHPEGALSPLQASGVR
ncbi:acyltransferase family protein [Methylobacterium dankookense]|uniref:Acyltransferase 3 domain-containing protein n=1 Tax=Methylobacterium dankookense TaxID=560405 RepID=A0A564FWZ1_9HYPH|nr:acyltransferase [Methylobacterium dankookense]GJD57925.1 hypothetical protein IFDJLNFL_3838 [Methylobacterium dankookense]VUF12286.1 hypothetical protein MTDSW087_01975 [Methylobacterium dankookense]